MNGSLKASEDQLLSLLRLRRERIEKPTNKNYLKARLKFICNVVSNRPGNVVPFTPAENDCICKLSWQSWDWLTDLLARGTAEELVGYMCEPELFTQPENRRTLVVEAHDATPVYLDMSTGKVLVRAEVLDQMRHRRLAKKMAAEGNEQAV